jgi:hypothetical protein
MTTAENEFDLIWGVDNIAKAIGRTSRSVYHMIARGQLAGVKEIAGRKCITKTALRSNFEAVAA